MDLLHIEKHINLRIQGVMKTKYRIYNLDNWSVFILENVQGESYTCDHFRILVLFGMWEDVNCYLNIPHLTLATC